MKKCSISEALFSNNFLFHFPRFMITNTQWKLPLHSEHALAQDVAQLAPPIPGGIKTKMLENVSSQLLILEKPKPTMTNMMEKTSKTTKTYTWLDLMWKLLWWEFEFLNNFTIISKYFDEVCYLKEKWSILLLSLLRYSKIILSIKHFSRWRDTWHFWQKKSFLNFWQPITILTLTYNNNSYWYWCPETIATRVFQAEL